MKMTFAFSTTLASYMLLLSILESGAIEQCPESCQCTNDILRCRNTNLFFVPHNLSADSVKLYLDHNEIMTLHVDSGGFVINWPHGAELIDLSFNNISLLSNQSFMGLSELKTLKLNNNRISLLTWPMTPFVQMNRLERLYLNGNLLTDLRHEYFDGLWNLKTMNLNDNRLTSFPRGSLKDLHNLNQLHLRGALENVAFIARGVIPPMRKLELLILSKNSLHAIDKEAFEGLPNLVTLDLSSNKLIDASFLIHSRLYNLTTLKLQSNAIAISAKLFSKLPSLQEINLSDNGLKTLPQFPQNASQITLGFSRNDFDCVCEKLMHLSLVCAPADKDELDRACLNCTNKYLMSPRQLTAECTPVVTEGDPTILIIIVLVILIMLLLILVVVIIVILMKRKKKQQSCTSPDATTQANHSIARTSSGHAEYVAAFSLPAGEVEANSQGNHTYERIRESWLAGVVSVTRSHTVAYNRTMHPQLQRSATQNTIQFPLTEEDVSRHYEVIPAVNFSSMQDLPTIENGTPTSGPYTMANDVGDKEVDRGPYAFASSVSTGDIQDSCEQGEHMSSLS